MIVKIYRSINKYFKNTLTYSNGRFIVELTVVSYIGKIALALLFISVLLILLNQNDALFFVNTVYIKANTSQAFDYIYALLIAPWLETIIFQAIPFWIASFFTKNLSIKFAILTAGFAIGHINPSSVISALFPGFVLAWSYVMKGKHSRVQGFWITTGIHFLLNVVAILLQIIGSYTLINLLK